MSRRIPTLIAALILGAVPVIGVFSPAQADHIYDTYRDRGYIWFASYDDFAVADVASTDCRDRELEAWDRVEATTVGEFPTRWPSGIRFRRYNCTGDVNTYVDVKLSYEPASNFVRSDGSTYGGWNESRLAPKSWCDIWSQGNPCGSHPSIVHLNRSRFTDDSYSHDYRRRLIMHETGHSLGLAHHCSSNAIMNDGTSGCNGGAWTNINGYQETDRQGIRDLYPNWKY